MTVWVGQVYSTNGDRYALMIADTYDELHRVAEEASIPHEQYSGHDGSCKSRPHYRITPDQRDSVMKLSGTDIRGIGFVYV